VTKSPDESFHSAFATIQRLQTLLDLMSDLASDGVERNGGQWWTSFAALAAKLAPPSAEARERMDAGDVVGALGFWLQPLGVCELLTTDETMALNHQFAQMFQARPELREALLTRLTAFGA